MKKGALPAGVGPHEGRELELLLSGKKPVAVFTLDGLEPEYEAEFEKAVGRKLILRFEFEHSDDGRLNRRYYCLPNEAWRVKLMEMVHRATHDGWSLDFSAEELHRMDGALLGYEAEDIESFVAHWRGNRNEISKVKKEALLAKRDET